MIILKLPFPPSLNSIYRTRGGQRGMYMSAAGKAYKKEVAEIVAEQKIVTLTTKIEMFVTAHMPDKRKRDLMNLEKVTSDALQDAGVFLDDYQIDLFQIVRGCFKNGGSLIVVIVERGE